MGAILSSSDVVLARSELECFARSIRTTSKIAGPRPREENDLTGDELISS